MSLATRCISVRPTRTYFKGHFRHVRVESVCSRCGRLQGAHEARAIAIVPLWRGVSQGIVEERVSRSSPGRRHARAAHAAQFRRPQSLRPRASRALLGPRSPAFGFRPQSPVCPRPPIPDRLGPTHRRSYPRVNGPRASTLTLSESHCTGPVRSLWPVGATSPQGLGCPAPPPAESCAGGGRLILGTRRARTARRRRARSCTCSGRRGPA